MTPEELAVVQAAMRWHDAVLAHPEALRPLHNAGNPLTPVLSELSRVTYALAVSCEECNAGGHTCYGDGNPIQHGEHACKEHDGTVVQHAGADGSCPDYGSTLDPCPPGCASGVCVANDPPATVEFSDLPPDQQEQVAALAQRLGACVCSRTKKEYCASTDCHGGADIEPALIWVPRTWTDVRPGDQVRMPGSEVTAHVQSAVHLRWRVKPGTGTSAYNPPERLAFGAVQVTLTFPGGGEKGISYEMDPGKPVEIELAESEVYVLNGLGWENRIGLVTG